MIQIMEIWKLRDLRRHVLSRTDVLPLPSKIFSILRVIELHHVPE